MGRRQLNISTYSFRRRGPRTTAPALDPTNQFLGIVQAGAREAGPLKKGLQRLSVVGQEGGDGKDVATGGQVHGSH